MPKFSRPVSKLADEPGDWGSHGRKVLCYNGREVADTLRRAILLGSLSALFFSSTFVLNRLVTLQGASPFWLASLRYVFTLPILAAVLMGRGELLQAWRTFWNRPIPWIVWGTVGFGLFYLPITMAARWAPAWLIAGGWQLTIVMGSLVVPCVDRRRVPWRDMWPSLIILAGVGAAEWSSRQTTGWGGALVLIPILIAAVAYPLGNRKMMQYTRSHLSGFSVYQRTFDMTLGSLPFWCVTMIAGGVQSGWPGGGTVTAAAATALFSGVVATLLFFYATDLARGDIGWLARIEATQSLEIFFTVLVASLLFNQQWPHPSQWIGLLVIMAGMVLHSLRPAAKKSQPAHASAGP